MAEEPKFDLSGVLLDAGSARIDEEGERTGWVTVTWRPPKELAYVPLHMRLRYTQGGSLECAELRIGEPTGADGEKTNITRTLLRAIPLGAALLFIQDALLSDNPVVSKVMGPLAKSTAVPRVAPGKRGHDERVYIRAAELFLAECSDSPRGNREVRRRLARQLGMDESTFNRHVQKGWEARPDLKPKGIRERRVKKPKEES